MESRRMQFVTCALAIVDQRAPVRVSARNDRRGRRVGARRMTFFRYPGPLTVPHQPCSRVADLGLHPHHALRACLPFKPDTNPTRLIGTVGFRSAVSDHHPSGSVSGGGDVWAGALS